MPTDNAVLAKMAYQRLNYPMSVLRLMTPNAKEEHLSNITLTMKVLTALTNFSRLPKLIIKKLASSDALVGKVIFITNSVETPFAAN